MLRLSKFADYGTSVMTVLAGSPETVRNAAELAQATHVTVPMVSKILKALARDRLVVSIRGAQGGYRLARAPEAITMAEVIAALEGPIALTECAEAQGHCSIEPRCAVRTNWQRINVAIAEALKNITLAEMTMPLPVQPLQRMDPGAVRPALPR